MSKKYIIIAVIVIIVAGAWWYWQSMPESPTSVSDEQASYVDSEVGVSNWNTYQNEEYGFEFKYPNDWFFTEDDLYGDKVIGLKFWSPENYKMKDNPSVTELIPNLWFNVISNSDNILFNDYFNNIYSSDGFDIQRESLKEVSLSNGTKVYSFQEPGLGDCCENVVFSIKKAFVEYSSVYFFQNSSFDSNRVENKILESFRLLN